MGNIFLDQKRMKKIYKELRNKIRNKTVLDSEIIRDIECEKKSLDFDINYTRNNVYCSLLMRTIDWNREKLVEYLLMFPDINVNYKDYNGHTAFYYACLYGYIPILNLLLSHQNLDVNIQDKHHGWTGLHSACWNGHIEIVRELLLDARINILILNNAEYMAEYIARWRHYEIANVLKRIRYTSIIRIPNALLIHDIIRMIIEEYV